MAKFIFKMQGILNIKQKLEEQEKINYGIARMRLNEEEDKLNLLVQKKEDLIAHKRDNMSGIVNPKELNLTENAIHGNDLAIEDQVRAVKRAEKALDLQRVKLENAIKERKTFEKLKENALEEFLFEEEKKEQQEINELVSYRHSKA